MQLLYPSSEDRCRPLLIVKELDGSADGIIGGSPPSDIAIPNGLRYFATVQFSRSPDLCISIFVASYDRLVETCGALNKPGQVIVKLHEPRSRAKTAGFEPILSPGCLRILPEESDWVNDEEGALVIRSGHKIGGHPYLIRNTPELLNALKTSRTEGFCHLLQIDFPSSEDAQLSGNWPFGDGIFCLFGRAPYGDQDWRWYWDF